jgi:hypothetical protein
MSESQESDSTQAPHTSCAANSNDVIALEAHVVGVVFYMSTLKTSN